MKCVTLTFPQRSQNNPLLGQVVTAPSAAAEGGDVDERGMVGIHLDVGDAEMRSKSCFA